MCNYQAVVCTGGAQAVDSSEPSTQALRGASSGAAWAKPGAAAAAERIMAPPPAAPEAAAAEGSDEDGYMLDYTI